MATTNQNGNRPEDRSIFRDLLAPVDEEKVLIPGESIVYDERRHWAILIRPMLEMLAGLILITSLTSGSDNIGVFGAILVLGAIGLILRPLRGRRTQQSLLSRVRTREYNRVIFFSTLGILVLIFLGSGNWLLTAILAILMICGRFLFRIFYWLYYERLYITNRRIVLAKAFFGSDIDTMPLTRVTDISYSTTVAADILGYGNLRVESAGQDQALSEILFLEKPNEFYNKLIERTTAAVGSVTENDEDDGSGALEP